MSSVNCSSCNNLYWPAVVMVVGAHGTETRQSCSVFMTVLCSTLLAALNTKLRLTDWGWLIWLHTWRVALVVRLSGNSEFMTSKHKAWVGGPQHLLERLQPGGWTKQGLRWEKSMHRLVGRRKSPSCYLKYLHLHVKDVTQLWRFFKSGVPARPHAVAAPLCSTEQ